MAHGSLQFPVLFPFFRVIYQRLILTSRVTKPGDSLIDLLACRININS
ncbi:hypothetical protein PAMC26577_37645 [Caballeronia sordidicola]|uniref:Uncharacterized protein n=1 Tax=Caballeronia sordidicola TaxID=196367 RepID=A0A242M634_CABSO|nr:hypothetical protein PAMC26577_37645 [Caballeronia sordidicola]